MKQQPATRVIPCPHCGQPTTVPNGLYLRQLRERAGLTQRDFVKVLKRDFVKVMGSPFQVSSPYVSDWERNRRTPPDWVVREYRLLRGEP